MDLNKTRMMIMDASLSMKINSDILMENLRILRNAEMSEEDLRQFFIDMLEDYAEATRTIVEPIIIKR